MSTKQQNVNWFLRSVDKRTNKRINQQTNFVNRSRLVDTRFTVQFTDKQL